MANTAEIIRLMRHAANRLNEEDAHEIVPPGVSIGYRERAISTAAAMTYAEAILRTVAAVLDESEAADG